MEQSAGDFDWSQTTALPEKLKKTFSQEPLYLDLAGPNRRKTYLYTNRNFMMPLPNLRPRFTGGPRMKLPGGRAPAPENQEDAVVGRYSSPDVDRGLSGGFIIAFYQYRQADERGKIALSRDSRPRRIIFWIPSLTWPYY